MTPDLEKAFEDFEAAKVFDAKLAAFDRLMEAGSHDPDAAKLATREQLKGLHFRWLMVQALKSAVAQLKRDEELKDRRLPK